MAHKLLTDLEAAIVGFVAKNPGKTRYSARRLFQSSLSGYWSGSSGAVYPAVDRLVKRGLLAESRSGTDRRPSKALSATRKGRTQLQKWMDEVDGANLMPIDPLRVRVTLLHLIHEKGHQDWLTTVHKKLLENMERLQRRIAERDSDELDKMTDRGAIALADAQIAWVKDELTRIKKKQRPR